MTDENQTPEQQASQAPKQPAPEQQVDWEARYKGSVTKINELTTQINDLKSQLEGAASEKEQLRSQLGVKDVEKDASIKTYKEQLEAALSQQSEAEKELSRLKALEAKMNAAKKLNAPELFVILDKIPFVENPEALETIMKDFVDWGQGLMQKREKEILAGYTPPSAATTAKAAQPNTAQEWEQHINSLPIGPEREQAWNEYWKWGQAQQK